jgi:Na+/H+-dicarboxylate symporter/ABC-type amino acid transport substrate-binding protein
VTTHHADGRSAKKSFSLSTKIAIGVGAGIVLGLLIGDRVAFLQVAADAYIRLLQMSVLPYVTVSIVSGLGALDAAHAKTLGKRAGAVVVLLWMFALTAVLLFPLTFPPHQSASFFSTSLVQEREAFDFLNLYIPTNPFNALANSVVPAVVLFSVVVGIALIGMPDKAPLLQVLGIAARAVSRATNFVVSLTPYGVFAIAAVVAGTLSPEELSRLEVYLVGYVGISLLLSLWVLPGLVAALTPVPYRALLSRTGPALAMAFMTTSLFAVLPLITEETKALVRDHAGGDAEQDAAADVIVASSFNLPHTGKLLSLSFVLFAGWFADTRVPLTEYPRLVGAGLFAMFGNVNAAIPFLLDLLRIPADTFRLFVTSAVVNARFGTLLAAVHTLAVAVLGTCAMTGMLQVKARKLVRFAVITGVLTAVVVGGTRLILQVALARPYTKGDVLTSMGMLRDRGTASILSGNGITPMPPVTTTVLDRVHRRGVLRVGYFEDSLPYVFVNQRGETVGFDVEMALQLARDLGVTAELVEVSRSVLDSGLDSSVCDIVMSGVAMTADRALHVRFSAAYLDETVAFVVPDHLVTAFSDWSSVKSMGRIRVGVPRAPYFVQKVRDELPDVEIVPIERMDDMFVPHDPPIDAMVATAERGSAYTLLHPDYSVAVPKPRPSKVPLAYVIAAHDSDMTSMVNTWIELKRKDGTIDQLFTHWILGEDTTERHRRWSILDDVLHWGRSTS